MPATTPSASPQFLRESEIRRGVELLFFGYNGLARSVSDRLETEGLGRAHHRALYFVARYPDLPVNKLLAILAITKQSLGRVINELMARGLIEVRPGDIDRRQRLLRLTNDGEQLEGELFELLRAKLSRAYTGAGQESVTGFWAVLEGLGATDAAGERQSRD